MMFLLLSLLPALLTVVALLTVPFWVMRLWAAAEAPTEGTIVGGWDALEDELALSEVDEVWCAMGGCMDEVEEWNALMDLAWGHVATVTHLPVRTAQAVQAEAA